MQQAGSQPVGEGGGLGARFWRLWWSSSFSNLADGILKTALPLLAVRLTNQPALVAGVAVAASLPWLMFALFAGVIADRADRRRLMVVANAIRAVAVGLIVVGVVFDVASIWLLYGVSFVIGMMETIYDTSAQSILPSVVVRGSLARANGRLQAAEITANQFIGPPIGGLVVGLSLVAAFAMPSLLWVVALMLLGSLSGTFRSAHSRAGSVGSDVAEGLRYLTNHPVLRRLAMATGISNLASSATFALLALYLVGRESPVGMSASGYGLLMTTLAIGSVIGTFLAEPAERLLGRKWALAGAIGYGSLVLGGPVLSTNPVVIGAIWMIAATGGSVWNVISVSYRQGITPDRLLGRMNSAYRLLAWGTMPIGAFIGGQLGGAIGIRQTMAVMWGVNLLAAVVIATAPAMMAEREEAG